MWRRAGTVMVALAVAGACSAGGGDGAPPATRPPSAAAVAAPVSTTLTTPTAAGAAAGVVPVTLDFSAPTVGGGQLDVRTYAGRNLALWFWAPY